MSHRTPVHPGAPAPRGIAARGPHPATVAQPKPKPGAPVALPPHPATIVRSPSVPPSFLVQRAQYGVSPKRKQRMKKKKNLEAAQEKEGMGQVRYGSSSWDCFNIRYSPNDKANGYISANFNPLTAPTRQQLPVDALCDVTIGATVYRARLVQLDINGVHFTRGNFTDVKVKTA